MKKKRQRHGDTNTRLYQTWTNMKARCNGNGMIGQKHYLAKDIKVCDAWMNDFSEFKKWAMLNGYDEELTIERIDVNQGYSPANCKWIPKSQQSLNTSRNIRYGNKILSEIVKELGLNYGAVQSRKKRGDSPERMFRPSKKYTSFYPGVSYDGSSKKPWRVRFGHNGKVYNGGRFETEIEAKNAYEQLKKERANEKL